MKGIKMTLDTTVNKNYVEDWRKVWPGPYDKTSDSLMRTAKANTWTCLVDHLSPAGLDKTGDFITISFDYYGDCQVGGYDLSKEAFVRCEGSGNTRFLFDTGKVEFYSRGKYHRAWVTYKLTQDKGPSFYIAIGGSGGTLHIRNIKVELSDHPTDYEE